MKRSFTLGLAAGMGLAALAVAVPTTVSAATCANGNQSSGFGLHHSFTHSHDNCVTSSGFDNTAYLTDSDGNTINMFGNSNTVEDFRNGFGNSITFAAGSFNNELNGSNATGFNVTLSAAAMNDFVDLVGTGGTGAITITGSNAGIELLNCTSTTAVTIATTGVGSEFNPIIITGASC